MNQLEGKCVLLQYWDSGCPPALIVKRMEVWRLGNPGFEYQLFDRERAASMIHHLCGTSVRDAFLRVRLPAMQADIFRVAYLYAHGGIWIDAATVCLAPLQKWLDLRSSLLLLRKPEMVHPLVWNGLIYAAAPHHPFLGAVMARISHSIINRTSGGVWRLAGPGLFRDIMRNQDLASQVTVVPLDSVTSFLRLGSSSEAMSRDLHWSVRQKSESLFVE